MFDQSNPLAKRMFNVLKTEGIKGFFRRIKDRLRSKWYGYHVFVISRQFASVSEALEFPAQLDPTIVRMLERCQRVLSSLTFKQVNESDGREIDELTAIDHWGHSRESIIKWLQEGWCCYVAKFGNRVVAYSWTKAGPEFYEPILRRWFTLADDEVYATRTFCLPDWRGRGVAPMLTKWIVNHLALTEGVRKHIGWVRVDNVGQMHTMEQMGWSVVGRLGIIETFGVCLQYIRGQRAFCATKKRFSIRG
ncbi:MAG TPA: GNAT family N-acetyltransferase [Syntrophales bacterium]|nr:GNAT family N-acetyltransferase [Syntrophales bacterium]